MNILAIDTSGRAGSLALRIGSRTAAEVSLSQSGRRHAQTLVAEMNRIVREAGLAFAALDGVAVSIGPGSFTGLRVGVTCAKTLAWATGCRVAAVDTLQAIAHNAPPDVTEVLVISDAQRGDLFAARYQRSDDGPFVRDGPIEIVDALGWCQARASGEVISGPGLDKYAADLPDSVIAMEPAARQPSAAIVAELGEHQLLDDRAADVWSLEPVYLRKSAAEEKADQGKT